MSCAPFVSSPHDVVRKMLEVAKATKDDVVVDLGCGDGRILATAVKDFGVKAAFGYEIREDLFKTASGEVEKLNLTTYANERLKPKLRAEAKPGSRIVSHDFMINGWKPSRKENYNEHTIYVYSIPESYSM